MKILIVHPYMSFYGGAELVVNKLATTLQKKDYYCDIATLSVSPDIQAKLQSINFITPQKEYTAKIRSTSVTTALGTIKEILALRKLVRPICHRYNLINVHNFPATWAVAGLHKPIVWMCNEPPELWNNPNPSIFLRALRWLGGIVDQFVVNHYIDKIVVADENNAKNIQKRYKNEFCIINYGINFNFFHQAKKDKKLIQKYNLEKKFVLIQVGMLTPQKNQLDTLEAVKKLANKIPSIKIIFAGAGGTDYEKVLWQYIKKNNLAKQVIFTGQVNQEMIRNLYAISHLAVFPVKTQGGWLSPFEALSAGVPVIVYPEMGAAAVIKKNKLGMVSDNLEQTIISGYNNYKKIKKDIPKIQLWIKKNLTWEHFTEKMLNIFEKVISDK